MNRRRFISLAGMVSAFLCSLPARAGQGAAIVGRAISGPASFNANVIKTIGVGGAGGNSVDHMIREGISGIEFMVANTDAQALRRSIATNRLQLGKSGLGAGADLVAGRDAAMEERSRIADFLTGTHMVFIVAGMGGGTGTGAAPVIAEVARELGIVTVAMVSTPFSFEGNRLKVADAGIAELSRYVNALIVFPNDRLMDVRGADVPMDEAFKIADNVMCSVIGDIARMINHQGAVGVDIDDVRTVLGRSSSFRRDAVHGLYLYEC